MTKENFIIDINKKMTDSRTSNTKYSLERCDSSNFCYMELNEVLLLIECLQNAVENELKERERK